VRSINKKSGLFDFKETLPCFLVILRTDILRACAITLSIYARPSLLSAKTVPNPSLNPAQAGPEIQPRRTTPVKRKRMFMNYVFFMIIELMGAKIDFFFEGTKCFRGKN
jgi:hypothetical protein